MDVQYFELADEPGLRAGVESLLVETFGAEKAGHWEGSFDRALASGAGWYVPDSDGNVVAVGIGELVATGLEELLQTGEGVYVHQKCPKRGLELRSDDVFGSISYLAVEPSHRGHDIGDELARRVFEGLASSGATVIYGNAWQHSGITSDRVFVGLGFERIEIIGDDEPGLDDPNCTTCGKSPCTCLLLMYAKRV